MKPLDAAGVGSAVAFVGMVSGGFVLKGATQNKEKCTVVTRGTGIGQFLSFTILPTPPPDTIFDGEQYVDVSAYVD